MPADPSRIWSQVGQILSFNMWSLSIDGLKMINDFAEYMFDQVERDVSEYIILAHIWWHSMQPNNFFV